MFVVGHSHVGAIRDAARARREADPARPRVRTLHVLDPALGGEFRDEARTALSDGLVEEMRRQIARHRPLVASALCGNMHAVLSLVRLDDPFDIILSGEPSPPIDPTARMRDEAEVEKELVTAMAVDLHRLTLLRSAIGPYVQIESPPPVAARSFIERRLEPYFAQQPTCARNGIAPGGIRYRMWRLSARIIRRYCLAMDCAYMPTPAGVRDASGFLRQDMAGNSTHANAAYGEAVIRALEAL